MKMDGFSNKNGDIMGIHGIPLGYRTTQNYKFEIWVCHVSEIGLYPQMASKASTNGIFSHSLLDHQMVNLWLAKMVSGSHSGTKKIEILRSWSIDSRLPMLHRVLIAPGAAQPDGSAVQAGRKAMIWAGKLASDRGENSKISPAKMDT